jgi:hypothetical protein
VCRHIRSTPFDVRIERVWRNDWRSPYGKDAAEELRRGRKIVIFIRTQRRIAAAMSDWFGVKVKGLPLMNTKDFDAFCRKRGLSHWDQTGV